VGDCNAKALATHPPFVKRVIGVPGDTLAMSRGVLYLNGRRVDEPYAWRDSLDSRYWGLLPAAGIRGLVRRVYFSQD
jgi:type IV secretory pathway protease TraF